MEKLFCSGLGMPLMRNARRLVFAGLLAFGLSSCYQPPYNNFKPYNRMYKDTATIGGFGTVAGAVAGSTLTGTGIGAAAGISYSIYKDSRRSLLKALEREDIQYIQYGDTMTLVVPTDRYFMFNSPKLNDLCYEGLVNIVKLLRCHVNCSIYVAGFTDDIGSREHKNNLSQARAEAMLTFLWANGIPAQQLNAEGYGDKHAVSDNKIIHGSAQNRRLEIQWFNCSALSQPAAAATK
ncbi:C-OmpA-like family protein CmpA [Legionella sp. 16cNR16C]|uniref:C-OmpA-like family protein CmpA n=1 Tax=Legionella sp. 16cNR16C TaxID=2905656 RepID=UPI001E39EF65|nr:C-OmpA-like family protein CmpA [Legionella sp. 16cNR16C]MCE3044585.1 C-OmpA-like family protein CmpA [Legionella sp. 16cNR16C]